MTVRIPMAKEDFHRSPSDPIGQNFGPYKLVRRLGVGGMAETFEAIRSGPKGFSQRVCLKLVLPFFRDSNDFIELFEREARLAAKLRHSNIVGVIDFGQVEGTPYMALELVDGVDLQGLLDAQPGKRLSHDYVALVGHDLAAALGHAHNPPPSSDATAAGVNAIIHRDISPSNVLLSGHGEILLTDFGVAKAVTGTTRKQSAVKGKVPYMSPEQLRAEPLDGRADLFGLGVVLFEALAGQRPYEGEHDPGTIMSILKGNHPSLQALAPDAPPELCRVIESLIEPERDHRPDNAAGLTELLDEFVPSPRVRRQLGRMVEKRRAEEPAPSGAEWGALEQSDTAFQSDAQSSESGIQSTGAGGGAAANARSRRRLRLALSLAASLIVIGASVAAGVVFWAPSEETPAAETSAPTMEDTSASVDDEPETNAPSPRVDESTAQADRPTDVPDERPTAAVPRPARLTVIVFPWGSVWINGKPQGLAPLKDQSLKPGRYKISAGQGSPSKTQTVRLRPGQRKTVNLDLTQ
jgi:serine/threonine-protein kinase